jgi:peptide deformylase
MTLPIVAYGHPNLRKVSVEIDKDYPGLDELIENMFETMYTSEGVGLAAPQVNKQIRLFIVDASPYGDENPQLADFKKIFINPEIIDETGEEWGFNEGCLSIPEIREEVIRKPDVRIQYYDRDFNFHDENYSGIAARIIQHEYDHLDGVLFVDKINSLRKMLLRKKLNDIATGNIDPAYRMIFSSKNKKRKKFA